MNRKAALALAPFIPFALAALPAVVGAAARGGSGQPPARVLIEKDAAYTREAAPLAARGRMRVIEDYGSFVLAEVFAGSARGDLAAAGLRVRREMPEGVRLSRREFTRDDAALAAPGPVPRPGRDDLHLVRLSAPARASWIDALRSVPGARILMTLPEDAYLVWLPGGSVSLLSRVAAPIDFAAPLPALDRISPDLDGRDGPLEVTALFVDTPSGQAARAAALDRSLVPAPAGPGLRGLLGATLVLTRSDLDEIANWPEVVWVEPRETPSRHDEVSSLLTAGMIDSGRPRGTHYRQWLSSHGLDDLSGRIVSIVDTGIDSGGPADFHPALEGRIAYSLDETNEGTRQDCVGHGTHIAGIIAGSPPPGADLRDEEGFLFGLGMAPTARVGVSRIFDCAGAFAPRRSFTEILTEAYALGARVSNNSWGAGGASYTILAREFDAIVRDVDSDPNNGDSPMVVVFSAGNRGSLGGRTVEAPSLAKNVISVGATESYRPRDVDGCGSGPDEADDPGEIRDTSARGPTVDGRLKPDVVAPGSHITSLVSSSRDYSGIGLCDPYYPTGQRLYSWTSGTSQAAAHVSGAAVLAMEWERRASGSLPSPALVKAMLVATARDIGRPQVGTHPPIDHRPNFEQGWGRVDLSGIVGKRFSAAFDQTDLLTASGQRISKGPFRAVDPSEPVSIVLAWTDAPGTPAGSSWVNDLDLEVVASGTTYLGNVFSDGTSVPGGSPDGRNNVEAVHLRSPGLGPLSVTVTAVSLPGDGVPSRAGLTDQDFALYLTNVVDAGSTGSLSLASDTFDCGAGAEAIVVDRQIAGGGSIRVTASTGAEPAGETFDLDETVPGSGVFRGTIPIQAGSAASDGAVQSDAEDTLQVRYEDVDGGNGSPAVFTAEAHVFCRALTISSVKVEAIESDRAAVTWITDRPADSSVTLDTGPGAFDPAMVRDHRVVLTGLSGCSLYSFGIASRDEGGERASYPASGGVVSFPTGSGRRITIFSDDFEAFSERWSHSGSDDEWELGQPRSGPGRARSGKRAWGTNLHGPYSETADAVLTAPEIDLRWVPGALLTFQHFLDIPLARTQADPQDGAWVEASIDGGVSFTAIGPSNGYPAGAGPNNPYLGTKSGVFAGVSSDWTPVTFDLSPFVGNRVRLRFWLWRDPGSASPTGAGWYIDDVSVTALAPCHRARLQLDSTEYGCSTAARVTLFDTDLDLDHFRRESTRIPVGTSTASSSLLLLETSPGSGEFSASAPLSPVPASGKLEVGAGDVLTASYHDADDGGGASATVTVSASIADCTPPPPPDQVRVESEPNGNLRVRWVDPLAADVSEVRVHYDADAPGPSYTGQGALEGASPVRAEEHRGSALLTGLAACLPHYVTLTAVDALGNESGFSQEVVGLPRGGSPCARATVATSPFSGAGCSETISVRIEDGNADPGTGTPGTLVATATSPSDPSPLALTLVETGPASGVFLGPLTLSPGVTPGALAVREGDTIEIAYDDGDTGAGEATLRAVHQVGDCAPPVISDAAEARLGFGEVRLGWKTDEPATSIVEFGLDAGTESTMTDPARTVTHAMVVGGVPSCATLHYRLGSQDARGNRATLDENGSPFRIGTARTLTVFSDDFETGAPGWTHSGTLDEWEVGPPLAGPPSAYSGTRVWGTDLDGRYEIASDMVLTSPEIDLVGVDSAVLTFHHWYDIFSSSPGAGFDDGAWVEVSADGGASWTYVAPAGGYPDRIAVNPYLPIGTGAYAGQSGVWLTAAFDLDAFTGKKISVRFRLYQDVYDETSTPTLGWYIDDVVVSAAVPCHQSRLRFDGATHDCGGAPLEMRLWDADLDTDPSRIETAVARVTSPSDPSPLDLYLVETGPATGVFLGTIVTAASSGPGLLKVAGGDVVRATVDDADDGTGSPATAAASIRIGDCAGPVISGVTIEPIAADEALVRWNTDEPSTSEVRVLASGAVFRNTSLTTGHSILIPGLLPCAVSAIEIRSSDGSGNVSTSSGPGAPWTTGGMREIDLLSEGFESGAPGWTHGGSNDVWAVGSPASGPGHAWTGAGVAATNLAGHYVKDRSRQSSSSWLISPWFDLAGVSMPVLSFRSFYSFARYTHSDGALVEAWDGSKWIALTPRGGYPGSVRIDRSDARTGAFTDVSNGDYVESIFDLDALGPVATRLRFRVILDHGIPATADGWYLDSVKVTGLTECRTAAILLDRDRYRCDSDVVKITLADTDLDANTSRIESVDVAAAIGASSLSVRLSETGPGTGVFTGSVPIDPVPAAGSLVATEGDVLEVTHLDADDGTGASRSVTASSPIADCSPPVVSGVRIDRIEGGQTLRARWRTDEPSTSEAALVVSGRPPILESSADSGTGHSVLFPGLTPCGSFTLSIASADGSGNRTVVTGTEQPYAGEITRRLVIFRDDMEGTDPGWASSGTLSEWERGFPTVGPPGAFSGLRVMATDLDGLYEGNTDATSTTPIIDLRGVSSASLSFWHFFDIFASGSPNAEDDGAWIEVLPVGETIPIYVSPVDSYNNTLDRDGDPPISGGSGVYAGTSEAWRRAVFDLTPFAGRRIQVRFRIWNDVLEAIFNQATGFGWYIDDVEIAAPGACAPAPSILSVSGGAITQGTSAAPLAVTGAGLRLPIGIDAGPGVTFTVSGLPTPSELSTLITVSPAAAAGPRDLRVTNPDGQSATLAGGIVIGVSPARADIDGSGAVDGRDLAILARAFGSLSGEALYSAEADLNADGVVDGSDLAILASRFGRPAAP